ncbi:hypothetical protein Taro_048099 [Colocasia esculenta]|uniref:Uncharacterized protein n=1 Tax=Colocasia esculenta TaxID=4460 RepID=A0A843X840_COLES|nr:hypothetical protein [Colocasia esculenta]
MMSSKEEVDPNALEVESDEEEESPDDKDEFEEDDEDDRYGTWRTEWEGFHLHRPRVCLLVHARDCLPVYAGDRDHLLDHASSATFPFFLTTRGKIDPGSASRYITTLVHAHIPGPVDAWREFLVPVGDLLYDMFTRRYAFTRPEDLPRARAVWESTAQTNLRKSMYEARDKAMKTTSSRDPTAWLDYGPVWLRRDYWKSLCHRWATGPLQERSQAAKRNRATHPKKNVHTSGSVSYATHSQKLETYDRTIADRYAEGTSQPDLYLEVWVDAAGGQRKGRVYGFGDSLDTTPVLSSYASLVAPPAYASSSTAPPGSGVEEIKTLIREELWTHFGVMVKQLISAMQGVRPSQPAP